MPRAIMGGHRSLEDAGAGGRQLDISDHVPVSRKRRLSGHGSAKLSKKPYVAPYLTDDSDEDTIAVSYHTPQSSSVDHVDATVSSYMPSRRSSTASLPSDPCAIRFRASNGAKTDVNIDVESYPSSNPLDMAIQRDFTTAEMHAFESQPSPLDLASIVAEIEKFPNVVAEIVAPVLSVLRDQILRIQILEDQVAEMTMQKRKYEREMMTNFRMLQASVRPSQSASSVETVNLF